MRKDRSIYHILLVEDNPGDRVLVEDFLSESLYQYHLVPVDNFREAKNHIESSEKQPDVILMDLTLPDVSREDLIERLSTISLQIPIIIFTGYENIELASRSLSQGISDYIVKDTLNATVLYKSLIYAVNRHKFLKSIKESEKKYNDIFRLSPDSMWLADLASLRFLEVNGTAVNHYGYSREEFLTMRLTDLFPSEEVRYLSKVLSQADTLTPENPYWQTQDTLRHLKKNGDIIYINIRIARLDISGYPSLLMMATNVTEKIKQLQAIEEQNRRLKEIAWIQSHVVRAPVARLMGIVDALNSSELTPEETTLLLNSIFESAREVDTVVHSIVEKASKILSQEQ